MTFIKPKDKIVAQLLFDLSNVTFLLGDFLVATKDYELAIDYGFDEAFANIRHSQSIHRVLKSREPAFDLRSVIGFSFLGISGLLLVFYIKRRKTKSLHAGG